MPPADHFRAHDRRPTGLSGIIHSEALGWAMQIRLIDLGLGGACVHAADSLPLGCAVRLQIDAPQLWEPLLLPARVAWTLPGMTGLERLGLRFEIESPSTLIALAELIGPDSVI